MSRVRRRSAALFAAIALLQPLIGAAFGDCASRTSVAAAHVTHAAPAHATHVPAAPACAPTPDDCATDRPGDGCASMVACQAGAVSTAPTIDASPILRVVERHTLERARYAGPELPPDDPPPRV
jgi:hypothetical protein